jgi:hypothetical protein
VCTSFFHFLLSSFDCIIKSRKKETNMALFEFLCLSFQLMYIITLLLYAVLLFILGNNIKLCMDTFLFVLICVPLLTNLCVLIGWSGIIHTYTYMKWRNRSSFGPLTSNLVLSYKAGIIWRITKHVKRNGSRFI